MGAVFDHKAWGGGRKYGDLAVGDITQLKVDGVLTDFLVVQQGNPNSAMYDDSCNGTWLLMQNIYENRQWHWAGMNAYAESAIHSYLNSTFLALFNSDVQNAITEVKIPYRYGNGSNAFVRTLAQGLRTKVFLIAAYEAGFSGLSDTAADGSCLSFFSGTSTSGTDSKRIAYLSGTAAQWWLRTPITSNTTSARCVTATGTYLVGATSNSKGIRPCLIMPSNQKIFS